MIPIPGTILVVEDDRPHRKGKESFLVMLHHWLFRYSGVPSWLPVWTGLKNNRPEPENVTIVFSEPTVDKFYDVGAAVTAIILFFLFATIICWAFIAGVWLGIQFFREMI